MTILSARGKGIDWNDKAKAYAHRREYLKRWREQKRKEAVLVDDDGEPIPQPNEKLYAMTHTEIAQELGVTKQRIGQIERIALKKLCQELHARGIFRSANLTVKGRG